MLDPQADALEFEREWHPWGALAATAVLLGWSFVADADFRAQADPDADTTALLKRYPKAKIGDFDGDPTRLTEMDALVAYLQMLGTLVTFADTNTERLQQ